MKSSMKVILHFWFTRFLSNCLPLIFHASCISIYFSLSEYARVCTRACVNIFGTGCRFRPSRLNVHPAFIFSFWNERFLGRLTGLSRLGRRWHCDFSFCFLREMELSPLFHISVILLEYRNIGRELIKILENLRFCIEHVGL